MDATGAVLSRAGENRPSASGLRNPLIFRKNGYDGSDPALRAVFLLAAAAIAGNQVAGEKAPPQLFDLLRSKQGFTRRAAARQQALFDETINLAW